MPPLARYYPILLLLLMLTVPAGAEPVEGVDYRRLAQTTHGGARDTIEIVEFFSYGCRACYEFQPRLNEWVERLPREVTLSRVPITFRRPKWEALARAYYTLQATDDLRRLDQPLFDALHAERQRLFDEASLTQWAALQGVNRELFATTYGSAQVSEQLAAAAEQARQFQIAMTPTLVINGEYVVLVRSLDQLLSTAQQLLEQVQTVRASQALHTAGH